MKTTVKMTVKTVTPQDGGGKVVSLTSETPSASMGLTVSKDSDEDKALVEGAEVNVTLEIAEAAAAESNEGAGAGENGGEEGGETK